MSLRNVGDYVRLQRGGDDAVLELLAQRHALRGKQVLELGCGPGRATGALAERHGAHVTATDASAGHARRDTRRSAPVRDRGGVLPRRDGAPRRTRRGRLRIDRARPGTDPARPEPAEAIERLESRAFSTMSLVPPAELTAAIAAAAELPETPRHATTMLVVSAS